jgi:hypothetical protein
LLAANIQREKFYLVKYIKDKLPNQNYSSANFLIRIQFLTTVLKEEKITVNNDKFCGIS